MLGGIPDLQEAAMREHADRNALAGEPEPEPFYRPDADGRPNWTEEGLRQAGPIAGGPA